MRPVPPYPIGVFLTSFWPGGTERQMIELVRRLDRRRFSVHVACFHRDGTWLPLVERAADSISEFPVTSFRSRGTRHVAAAFRRWCRSRRLALLHTSDLYANIFALPIAASAGVRVRIGSRRELNPDKTVGQLAAQRAAYAFAHRIVANSSAAVARLRREGVRRRFIALVPNGIDLERFHPAGTNEAAGTPGGLPDTERGVPCNQHRAGQSAGVPLRRLVTVARLRPEKGHDVLIDAAAPIMKAFPDATLTIIGDGALRSHLAARIEAMGAGGRVRLAGHTDDVAAALRDHDVFVLPSRSEAFPNSVIEAMATGLPVVATAVGGIPELIEHGRNGLLVPSGSAEELATAVIGLLRRPSFARALGRKGRADVVARYSFDRMVDQLESLYLAEIGERRPFYHLRSHSEPATS